MKIQVCYMGQSNQVKKLNQDVFRDGYEIEGELSRLLKIQVAQKKVKIAFENADSSSRVELIPSKIKYAIKVVLSFHNEFLVSLSLSRKENDGLLQD
uniref:Uncharacterized protein n=1 Tax=Tanacetum cinerariifolium TaxID=118510 RepID=A0A699K107_TANCI|nr:hypothetical protein [Tanacetum cinerariifolium]